VRFAIAVALGTAGLACGHPTANPSPDAGPDSCPPFRDQQWGSYFATALAVDSCGRVLVAGSTDGTLPGATSAGRRDALLMRAFAE
jgi:hypothetical protein